MLLIILIIRCFRLFRTFDLIKDSGRCVCPMCDRPVIPVRPGFNNCYFRITARKKGSTDVFQLPWTHAGDEYTYCSKLRETCSAAAAAAAPPKSMSEWERMEARK